MLQALPRWTTAPKMSVPLWVGWFKQHLLYMGTTYMALSYTDGSYTFAASISAYFHQSRRAGRAFAELIVKVTSEIRKRKPMFVMHILKGHEIGAESVYTTEYLALAASMQLSAHTQTLHVHKSHLFNLQCTDEAIHCGSPLPYHV